MIASRVLNAMTVDVEDYFHVSALSKSIRREDWHLCEYRADTNTDRLLQLFSDHGIRATFFVLGWITQRSPSLVRRIHSAGHEIACHGLNHDLVYQQSPDTFCEETRVAKQMLEDVTGAAVLGYRAASYSVTKASIWALDVLVDLGFKYDSSVFPIRHDRYGIPDAATLPGELHTVSGRTILEFPLSTWSVGPFRVPVCGGGYFRLFPYWLTRHGLNRINANGGNPFIFYLHPWEIDPLQPRIDASLLSRFRHYNNLDTCEQRLRQLLGDFSFGAAHDVLMASLRGRAEHRACKA